MLDKKFEVRFESKEDLIEYGQENLHKQLLNIVSDIDEKYIIRTHGMDEQLYTLFGFNTVDDMKEKLDGKDILNLKSYLEVFIVNIFKSLSNTKSFIHECFHRYYYRDPSRDLNIRFELKTSNLYKDSNYDVAYKHTYLELCIMSYQKGYESGSGRSFNFDLVDSEKLNRVISEVKSMDIPESVKEMYIDYFNDEADYNLDVNIVKEWVVEGIVECANDFVYQNEEDYKNYKTLKEQGFKEKLIHYINNNRFAKDISDAITIDYGVRKATSYDVLVNHVDCKEGEFYTDNDKVDIKFLGEIIKTIRKSSYTVYEIK